ncbi:hypothetical protein MPH_09514 [Macrophomina phaseolina MS6]|uniref:Uncharacterized protein n=1 Tax=Macrophomina phaseolina (strain MS6) TaxID=1126212 RepID=K2RSM6_MACPH|nr:hypothetical protein MPH_09514 [Macrophomina phaseolina MS6]
MANAPARNKLDILFVDASTGRVTCSLPLERCIPTDTLTALQLRVSALQWHRIDADQTIGAFEAEVRDRGFAMPTVYQLHRWDNGSRVLRRLSPVLADAVYMMQRSSRQVAFAYGTGADIDVIFSLPNRKPLGSLRDDDIAAEIPTAPPDGQPNPFEEL